MGTSNGNGSIYRSISLAIAALAVLMAVLVFGVDVTRSKADKEDLITMEQRLDAKIMANETRYTKGIDLVLAEIRCLRQSLENMHKEN